MMKWIPNKNKCLESETTYLEQMHEKGWKLQSRGYFFYRFEEVRPEKVTYGIDLLPKELSTRDYRIQGWELIESHPIPYKGLKRVYYVGAGEDDFKVDLKLRYDYYNRESLWAILVLFLLIMLFVWPQLNEQVDIPDFINNLLPLALIVIFYGTRRGLPFVKGAQSLDSKVDSGMELTINVIILHDLTESEREDALEGLKKIGTLYQHSREKNKDFCTLRTSCKKIEDLREKIKEVVPVAEERIEIGMLNHHTKGIRYEKDYES